MRCITTVITGAVIILQIKYGSSVQLGLLRLLSESVTQRFTYYCSGSVAWFDQSGDGHDSAITLRGDNDYEFETSKFSFQQVVHDGCRVSLVCSAFPCWKKYVEKKIQLF